MGVDCRNQVQGLSQDLETGCSENDNYCQSFGHLISQVRTQYTQITTINMYLPFVKRTYIVIHCHWNYMKVNIL